MESALRMVDVLSCGGMFLQVVAAEAEALQRDAPRVTKVGLPSLSIDHGKSARSASSAGRLAQCNRAPLWTLLTYPAAAKIAAPHGNSIETIEAMHGIGALRLG